MFQVITTKPASSDAIRRPTRLDRILEIAQGWKARSLDTLTLSELIDVADKFRGESNFLRPYASQQEDLSETTRIDISHESLMRKWTTLAIWIAEESKAAVIYREVVIAAERYYNPDKSHPARLWTAPELPNSQKRLNEHGFCKAWALQYGSEEQFDQASRFLQESENAEEVRNAAQREQEKRDARAQAARRWFPYMAGLAAVAIIAAAGAFSEFGRARHEAQLAADNARRALQQTAYAEKNEIEANKNATEARKNAEAAATAQRSALSAARLAEEREREARQAEQKSREIALKAVILAQENGALAKQKTAEAARANGEAARAKAAEDEAARLLKENKQQQAQLDAANRIPSAIAEGARALALASDPDQPSSAPLAALLPKLDELRKKDQKLLESNARDLIKLIGNSLTFAKAKDPVPITAAVFAPQGWFTIAPGSYLRKWNLSCRASITNLGTTLMQHYAFSPEGTTLAGGSQAGLVDAVLLTFFLNPQGSVDTQSSQVKSFRVTGFAVTALDFSPTGRNLAIADTSGWWRLVSRDRLLHPSGWFSQGLQRFWNGTKLVFALIARRASYSYPVQSFAVSDVGSDPKKIRVATVDEPGFLRIYGRKRSGHPEVPVVSASAAVANPKQEVLAVASLDRVLLLSGARTLTETSIEPDSSMLDVFVRTLRLPHVTALAWSADGLRLAVGYETGQIAVLSWDAGHQKLTRDLPVYLYGHTAPIHVLRWDAGSNLLSASSDGQLRWWNLEVDANTRELLDDAAALDASMMKRDLWHTSGPNPYINIQDLPVAADRFFSLIEQRQKVLSQIDQSCSSKAARK